MSAIIVRDGRQVGGPDSGLVLKDVSSSCWARGYIGSLSGLILCGIW